MRTGWLFRGLSAYAPQTAERGPMFRGSISLSLYTRPHKTSIRFSNAAASDRVCRLSAKVVAIVTGLDQQLFEELVRRLGRLPALVEFRLEPEVSGLRGRLEAIPGVIQKRSDASSSTVYHSI